jgi:GNAT superfamily N-acetyltransferase
VHWGAGHGHTLHTEALDVAHASGAAAAILWVLTTNQRARHFYERHGWTADGAEKTAWRGDVRLDETRYRISMGARAPTP